jgi:hypothetical protein
LRAISSYPHSRDKKLQVTNGAGLAIRFVTVNGFGRETPLKRFIKSGLGGVNDAATDWKILVSVFLSYPQWQADTNGSQGGA